MWKKSTLQSSPSYNGVGKCPNNTRVSGGGILNFVVHFGAFFSTASHVVVKWVDGSSSHQQGIGSSMMHCKLANKKQKLLVRSRYHNMCRYFTLQTWLITKLSILHVLTFWQFFSRFQDFHLEKIINPWVQMMWHLELRHCKISSKHPPQNGIDHEWFSLVGNNINALGHCQLSMGFLTPINGPLNRFPCI